MQRLLEAKAAVDAQNQYGPWPQMRDLRGKTSWMNCRCFKFLAVALNLFCKVCQTLAPTCGVVCDQDYLVSDTSVCV